MTSHDPEPPSRAPGGIDLPTPVDSTSARRRDLLQTLVVLCIGLTPAWLLPAPASTVWLVVGLILGVPAVWWTWWHAPWVPTPDAEVSRIVRHLELRPGQRFCDLGAGDGRLVVRIARATGARCDGIEASPVMYLLGRLRIALAGTPNAAIRLGDLYRADLSTYDAVYVWGTAYSVGAERFGRRMREALRPGARLVSYHQPVHGLVPIAVDADGLRPFFVYVVPPEPG